MINSEAPDLLLPYMHGAGGRLFVHLIMLSPDIHSWSDQLEAELLSVPIAEHADYKLAFFKRTVFPSILRERPFDCKVYEPAPFGLTYQKTKRFIRHAWMKESLEDLQRFNCKKIAYTDFSKCKFFTIRAVFDKQTFGIADPDPNLEPTQWYRSDSEEETRLIIIRQLNKAQKMLDYWLSTPAYRIATERVVTGTVDEFVDEYEKLCNYYEVQPMIRQAIALWRHWQDIQWHRDR